MSTEPDLYHQYYTQTKRSVLYSQLLRAKRLGSNPAAKDRGMDKITTLFSENGYPNKLIQRTRHRVTTRNAPAPTGNKTDKQHTEQDTFISLPYIDETLARRVHATVKTSKLPVRLAWKSGKTLSSILTRSALEPPPCPAGNRTCHTCQAGLAGKCHTKNVIYHITCTHCPDNTTTYIGETRRSVRERYREHLRDFKNSMAPICNFHNAFPLIFALCVQLKRDVNIRMACCAHTACSL